MTNELAASLIEVAYAYTNADRRIPDHLAADLLDVANCDSIAQTLRSQARRLLSMEAA